MSGATTIGSGVGKNAAPLERLQAQLEWLCRKGGARVFEFLKYVSKPLHTPHAPCTVRLMGTVVLQGCQPACVTRSKFGDVNFGAETMHADHALQVRSVLV